MILLLKYRYSFYFVKPKKFPFFKWQYRAGAGAGAKIMGKVDSTIFGSATLFFFFIFLFLCLRGWFPPEPEAALRSLSVFYQLRLQVSLLAPVPAPAQIKK